MIRVSEAVLPGHPDKLCDFVAESIVAAAVAADPQAYAQIEVGLWHDHVWLSGGYSGPLACRIDPTSIARSALTSILGAVNHSRAGLQWRCTDTVRVYDETFPAGPHVNDQSIVLGWAGYDARVRFLPPEHFLALEFRTALWRACCAGRLADCGPDGKLLVRLREDGAGFTLEHVLVTLEHPSSWSQVDLAAGVGAILAATYGSLRRKDARWGAVWRDVELLVNPNGPLTDAGSRTDNGQTGRKLVMDYYGPRVPLGGGAFYGKSERHVDRFGARAARRVAVDAVRRGGGECQVRAVYAPNVARPLDVSVERTGRPDVRIETAGLAAGALTAVPSCAGVDARSPLDWL